MSKAFQIEGGSRNLKKRHRSIVQKAMAREPGARPLWAAIEETMTEIMDLSPLALKDYKVHHHKRYHRKEEIADVSLRGT